MIRSGFSRHSIQQQLMSFAFLMIMLQIVTGILLSLLGAASGCAGCTYCSGKPGVWRSILSDAKFIPVSQGRGGSQMKWSDFFETGKITAYIPGIIFGFYIIFNRQ